MFGAEVCIHFLALALIRKLQNIKLKEKKYESVIRNPLSMEKPIHVWDIVPQMKCRSKENVMSVSSL